VNFRVGFWGFQSLLIIGGTLGPHGRGITTMGFVIIPFDYDQLSDDQKKSIVPICIASVDRFGPRNRADLVRGRCGSGPEPASRSRPV
jgi:hypothetical protein